MGHIKDELETTSPILGMFVGCLIGVGIFSSLLPEDLFGPAFLYGSVFGGGFGCWIGILIQNKLRRG